MLSFELSLLVVLMAVIVLLILYVMYLTEPPPARARKITAKEKNSVEERIPPKTPTEKTMERREGMKKPLSQKNLKNPLNCPRGLGYLKKRNKNTPIPDDCLSCSNMLECLGSGE